jgi:hypothetical protein
MPNPLYSYYQDGNQLLVFWTSILLVGVAVLYYAFSKRSSKRVRNLILILFLFPILIYDLSWILFETSSEGCPFCILSPVIWGGVLLTVAIIKSGVLAVLMMQALKPLSRLSKSN